MNIGQILENHLGWAARALGMQIENNAEGLVERLTGVGYDVEKYGIPETVEIGKFGDKSIKAVQISVPVFAKKTLMMRLTLQVSTAAPKPRCMTAVPVNRSITKLPSA